MIWGIAISVLFSQAEGSAEDTTGTAPTDTVATPSDTTLAPGGNLEEQVIEKGQYRISDQRMPLLDMPFDALDAVQKSLSEQSAPGEVISALQNLSGHVRASDTAGAFSSAQNIEIKGDYARVGEFLYSLADFEFGRYNFSSRDLKAFVDANRGFPLGREARALAVLSYLYAGDYKEGQLLGSAYVNEAQEDVKFGFWNGWTYWATGMCSYYKGDYEVAERYFAENISHNPDAQVVLYSRLGAGWCNLHEGRFADARSQMDMVMLSAEQGSDVYRSAELGKAIAIFNLDKYQEAYAMLKTMHIPLPKNPELATEILYHRGFVCDAMRDFTEAERSWRKIVEDYATMPRAADAAFKLGESYAAAGNNESAISMLEWLVKQFPDYPKNDRAIYMLAEMYFSQKEYRKALIKFKEFVARFPYNRLVEDVKTRMEQTYFAIAMDDESILGEFEEVFPNSDELADAIFYWGTKHYDAEEYDSSAALFYKMATLFPKHSKAPDALFFAGQIYYQQKKWAYAASTLDKFVNMYPDSKHQREAVKLVGISYVMMDRPQKAIDILTDLLKTSQDPAEQADAYRYLGVAYIKIGNVPKADQCLEEAAILYNDLGRIEDNEAVNKLREQLPQ